MANFIQKFADMQEYNDAEHQYPNISLVEGEGLVWEAEAPAQEPDVLLNASEIKWGVTDGQERTSVDYPSISFADASNIISAHINNGYYVEATGWYDDGRTRENVDFTFNIGSSDFSITAVFGGDDISVATVYLFTNAKAPAPDAVGISVSKATNPTSTWYINYELKEDGGL